MKRLLPVLILLFASLSTNAQNWNPLNPGATNYFKNANGYVRSMRIDSLIAYGNQLHYYPYKRLHFGADGYYNWWGDPNTDTVGSWLGGDVIRISDGSFLFPNYWNDTIKVKTLASVGEVWTFYQGADSTYYTAEVTALDTMTVLGLLDSVRRINLTAYQNGSIYPADSFHNAEIVLSKNHGFVAALDLYFFPYYAADAIEPINDYYLANSLSSSTDDQWIQPSLPGKRGCIFKLFSYVDPPPTEFVQWEVGDVYEYNACFAGFSSPFCDYPYSHKLDTVIAKIITNDGVKYALRGWRSHAVYTQNNSAISHYNVVGGSDTLFVANTGKYFSSRGVPEIHEQLPPMFGDPRTVQYYVPVDQGSCLGRDVYVTRYFTVGLGGQGATRMYIKGVGPVDARSFSFGDWTAYGYDRLIYSVRSGVTCGSHFFPDTTAPVVNYITNINETSETTIYPNPASGQLNIETSLSNYQLSLINVTGQVVYHIAACKSRQTIDVEGLANGVYNLKLETAQHEVINRKVVIQN
jgi:hypothetical protein